MSKWAPHLIGLATPLSAIICLMIGGWWMIVPIVLLLGIYPFMDTLAGSTTIHDTAVSYTHLTLPTKA